MIPVREKDQFAEAIRRRSFERLPRPRPIPGSARPG